mgnify:CR=1 FL=1
MSEYVQTRSTSVDVSELSLSKQQCESRLASIQELEKSASVVNEFRGLLDSSDSIVAFRALEVLIQIASVSNEHLTRVCQNLFDINKRIHHLLNVSKDILSQMNCVELLTDLVRHEHGYQFLKQNGHLNDLAKHLSRDISADPFASLMTPAIVKMFAVIARARSREINESYPVYFRYLFASALDEDVINSQLNINLALETFIFLFEANTFKFYLHENFRGDLVRLIQRLVWLLKNCINDKIKANSFICVAFIISADPELLHGEQSDARLMSSTCAPKDSRWYSLAHDLFSILCAQIADDALLARMLGYAKKPFVDLRLASHFYLKALAHTHFGLRSLFRPSKSVSQKELIDGYLLNRSTELEKDGMESKYELIKLIVANFTHLSADLVDELVGEENLNRMSLFIKQGPIYSVSESSVAFESS